MFNTEQIFQLDGCGNITKGTLSGKINVSALISRTKSRNTSHEFRNITHYQKHNLMIYGVTCSKVEKLDQPQNVRVTKCGKSSLPFAPSIRERVKRLGAHLMAPLVIMLKFLRDQASQSVLNHTLRLCWVHTHTHTYRGSFEEPKQKHTFTSGYHPLLSSIKTPNVRVARSSIQRHKEHTHTHTKRLKQEEEK